MDGPIYFPDTFDEFLKMYSFEMWNKRLIKVVDIMAGINHYFYLTDKENQNGEQSEQDKD